jgi:3-oxoacyl-[acyl-carrier protein] reductase
MSKSILITGACGALGTALCKEALRLDFKVYALCREIKNRLDDIHYYSCDLSDSNAINKIPDKFFDIDVLINNASMKPDLQITHKREISDFSNQIDTGLLSSIKLTQRCIKSLLKKNGVIVNILSSYTIENMPKGCSPYIVQKYGLLGFGLSLQREYQDRNIFTYNVSPNVMETPFLNNLPEPIIEKLITSEQKTTPLKVSHKIYELIQSKPKPTDNLII